MNVSDPKRRIYLDSNVFIYAIEGDATFAESLRQLFGVLRNRQGYGVTSDLTLAEVLPKADLAQRQDYFDLIVGSTAFELYPVSRDILVETAGYRRSNGMPKLADAIHIVTALHYGCTTILSGDQRMKIPEGIFLIDTNPESVSRLIQELS